mmetsp:Transcript_22699/g.41279  ORF Transcript_22699/g.41279 Transcript_22699/m.41279 type:complete len:104 (+) Transcript_22699:71-382(+)
MPFIIDTPQSTGIVKGRLLALSKGDALICFERMLQSTFLNHIHYSPTWPRTHRPLLQSHSEFLAFRARLTTLWLVAVISNSRSSFFFMIDFSSEKSYMDGIGT